MAPRATRGPAVLGLALLCLPAAACRTEPEPFVCSLEEGDPRRQAIETACDGADNDCDGVTDVLMPVAANRCAGPDGCEGFAACDQGAWACLSPPAAAEAHDGQDEDCNGITDDVLPGVARPLRLRVLVPPYLWAESPKLPGDLLDLLEQTGIPFRAPSPEALHKKSDWDVGMGELADFAVVLVAGSARGAAFTPNKIKKLQKFAADGGVVVLLRVAPPDPDDAPADAAGTAALLHLAGLAAARVDKRVTHVDVAATTPLALYLDSTEERRVLLTHDVVTLTNDVVVYEPRVDADAVAFGTARAGAEDLGAALVRRQVGQGAIYTIGFNLLRPTDARCYLNCFEPGRDVLAMLLRAAFREAVGGHTVLKHTVPAAAPGALVLTHDVDAPDAYRTDKRWGDPGALQMARMQRDHGVRGTYFLTTDYVTGYFAPGLIGSLCKLGMCPEGIHSVQHVALADLPRGDCSVTDKTYVPVSPTVCGEIAVSQRLVHEHLPAGVVARAWRSPYLSVHPDQFEVLGDLGFWYDSSYSVGDLRTNLPVSTARYANKQHLFRGQALHTFPVAIEDGTGGLHHGLETRTELQRKNQPVFLAWWQYTLMQNLRNGAWTVLLVHPSYGVGVGPQNLAIKIDSVERMIRIGREAGAWIGSLDQLGAFWRGREGVVIDARWLPGTGYMGEVGGGPLPVQGLTLLFGDRIHAFRTEPPLQARVEGRYVVFEEELPAGSTVLFVAEVEAGPRTPDRGAPGR